MKTTTSPLKNLLEIDTSADYCHSDKIHTAFTHEQIQNCEGFNLINHNTKSWTASRVGVTAARAFAYATGKPLYENGKEVNLRTVAPFYNSDFKVTIKGTDR